MALVEFEARNILKILVTKSAISIKRIRLIVSFGLPLSGVWPVGILFPPLINMLLNLIKYIKPLIVHAYASSFYINLIRIKLQ